MGMGPTGHVHGHSLVLGGPLGVSQSHAVRP
jgi:hypothetical protein